MKTIAPILEAVNDHPYISLVSAVLGCATLVRLARRRRSNLPPGPKGYPVVGNLFDLPPAHVWEKFGEFGEKYGALPVLCCHTHCTRELKNVHEFPCQVKSYTSTSWEKI